MALKDLAGGKILNPNLITNKTVDKPNVTIGDTFNYTISISNTGTADAINVNLIDLIPQGANFVTNSLYVNNVNLPGQDPALGIDLSTIAVGSTSTITMQAVVVNLPPVNPMQNCAQIDYQYNDITTTPNIVNMSINTNTVPTTIKTATINVQKYTSSQYAVVGDTIVYNITIVNTGTTTATNLVFTDTMPVGTTFIPGSVFIGSSNVPSANPSPPGGMTFSSLSSGYLYTVKYSVSVVSIPPGQTITNFGDVAYQFTIDPSVPNGGSGRSTSNIVTTTTAFASLSGMTMAANKNFASCGDIITYTITIPNSGSVPALNVIITDTVPNGATFVPGSISVNGVSTGGTPSSIFVGTIPGGSVATVTYQLQITC